MFSEWAKAFPISKQDTSAVAKTLLTEKIPRWGVPDQISSDNCTPFFNNTLQQVGDYLGTDVETPC